MQAVEMVSREVVGEVPLLDLKAQYAPLETEILAAIRDVCASQQFILGTRVAELERRIAAYAQCRFGIGVSSGTDALLAAFMALGVGPGDEVITSPYSFFATAGVIARLNARPLFCDIDATTLNLSPAAVSQLLGNVGVRRNGELIDRKTGGRIKALLPVHLFGRTADMAPLAELAAGYGLRIVEDAAQAIGAECEGGMRAGGIGDIGCFSFFPSKNLGAFGDAGMCTTNDASLAERLRMLRTHGAKPKYHHTAIGGNFRLDELQAAVLLVKLGRLAQWTARRQANAAFYDDAFQRAGLSSIVQTPQAARGCRHVYNQYVIRVRDRDALRRHLSDAGIGSEIYYPEPLHAQPCFAYLGYGAQDFPEASRAARDSLAIPIYPELGHARQQRIVDTIAAHYR